MRELERVRGLFVGNVGAFEELAAGLGEWPDSELADCLKHIRKAAEGKESRPPEGNIVSGIQIVREHDLRSLSREGAHS